MADTMTQQYVNTQWTTCGRKLLRDGHSFFIRGVNYAPTPIGMPGRMDMLGEEDIFKRDLVNLRKMHANAIKTYDFYSYVNHTPFLDAAFNNGVDPIYAVFSIWIDQGLMDPATPINSKQFQQMVKNYHDMAYNTGFHPGVIGYSIGGEMNSITVINEASFWKKFDLLTQAVRRGLAAHGATKIITTTFVDDGGMTFSAGELHGADVDMWGSNVYQTDYPGSVIPTYMRVPGGKPLLVSEYGMPYASNTGEGTPEELEHVAKMLTRQTIQMEQNYNLTDVLHEQVVVGGFVFEYSDEWWKMGNENVHNLGLTRNWGFPLGYLSEEHFGMYRIERSEEGLDLISPRPTVEHLTQLWGRGPNSLSGVHHSSLNCNQKPSSVSLNAVPRVAAPGHQVDTESFLTSISSLVFGLLMIALVLAAMAFAFKTKSRRNEYRPLTSTAPTYSARAAPAHRLRRNTHDAEDGGHL